MILGMVVYVPEVFRIPVVRVSSRGPVHVLIPGGIAIIPVVRIIVITRQAVGSVAVVETVVVIRVHPATEIAQNVDVSMVRG